MIGVHFIYNIFAIFLVVLTVCQTNGANGDFQVGVAVSYKCISDSGKRVEVVINEPNVVLLRIDDQDYSQKGYLMPYGNGIFHSVRIEEFRNGKGITLDFDRKTKSYTYYLDHRSTGQLNCGDKHIRSAAGYL